MGFVADEAGNMSVMTLILILPLLALTGIGVDVMRYERDRSKLQHALDRAVLAAADLDQTQDPKDVVLDYLAKEGLAGYISADDITVTPEFAGQENTGPLGYRIVEAEANATFYTQFMKLSGVDELTTNAHSIAEERIGDVEISLVLDVSGSMNSNSKLANLKVAAKDFVDTMVENTQDGKLSISIVPYATQVSVPENMMNEYTTHGNNTYSRCVNFNSSSFGSTSIDTSTSLERTMHFDPWYRTDFREDGHIVGMDPGGNSLPVCEAMSNREILPLQKDPNTLKDYIDDMVGRGNTSIDVGMKWGTAMLDPTFKPVVEALIDDGTVSSDFDSRPFAFGDAEKSLKVIVLMTDGKNTSQYYIKDDFRSGDSNVYWNEEAGRYSIYVPDYNEYYWPDSGNWRDHAYGEFETGDAVRL
ncbi:MAG: pilus assembly protein TadG-related protein, partial [Pseudomonadota bacterium]